MRTIQVVILMIILLGVCISIITLGLFKFYSYTPVNENEVTSVLGTYKSSSYELTSKSTYELKIKLMEYEATFYIWSVPLKSIKKESLNTLTNGEKVNIQILTADLEHLNNSNKHIIVYGFTSNKHAYLKLDDVNYQQKENSKLGFIISIVFSVALLFMLIFIYSTTKRLKRKK
ncbi:hypothetical protein [Paenibacillus sinopodophylli]|uniref:hypothetical protein n=1 Tax=Paenibacillus sinopodophylli TaxID=1837342 RepID=UPI00110CE663|nr:hypothetical protein [Paenibacillus sinopodophylli]